MTSKVDRVLKIPLAIYLLWLLGDTILPIIENDKLILTVYLIGIMTIITLAVFGKLMRKRTKGGNKILGKIKGFKRFLETAEKDQLEALVNQNPEYFYDILPYTYVLGVSDVWMKKFETIAMKPPDWYNSNGVFDLLVFNSFVNNTMKTAQTAMTSSPSSSSSSSGGGSSSGGFSGGGSSGGGSGGGGGGSW